MDSKTDSRTWRRAIYAFALVEAVVIAVFIYKVLTNH